MFVNDLGPPGYRSPVAERLADDVSAARTRALVGVEGGFDNWHQLMIALRAVSIAAGREGRQLGLERIVGRAGSVPTRLWLRRRWRRRVDLERSLPARATTAVRRKGAR